MAILVKNAITGDIVKVNNVQFLDGAIVAEKQCAQPGHRFFGHFPFLKNAGADMVRTTKEGQEIMCMTFTLDDNYEVVTKERKQAEKRAEVEKVERVEKPQPQTQQAPTKVDGKKDDAAELIAIISRLKGGDIDAEAVRNIVSEELEKYYKEDSAKVAKLAKKAHKTDENEVFCEDFEDICADLAEGFNVYLYGPAGCGKSYTAEQVAKALNLPYFEAMQMEFAHELKGYGDAAGRFIETPFYKAMTLGGLFFLDEFDRSNQQITTVINTVLESRRFDFPVVGSVQAHPNFRILAAGNTTMTGLNADYVAANMLDASTRNRFVYYGVNYDRRVELPMCAKGDEELQDFIEDVRQSISEAQIPLIVSYRTTKYLAARSDKKAKALHRGMLQGNDTEMARTIYGGLRNKANKWAEALRSLC